MSRSARCEVYISKRLTVSYSWGNMVSRSATCKVYISKRLTVSYSWRNMVSRSARCEVYISKRLTVRNSWRKCAKYEVFVQQVNSQNQLRDARFWKMQQKYLLNPTGICAPDVGVCAGREVFGSESARNLQKFKKFILEGYLEKSFVRNLFFQKVE